ncbi:hypothetical protein JR064_00435 [Xanthomonas sp. CFBP 8703]|uniref:Uncharacterized protein n=1 Tax=Xanthomonas bonasiae TaxID=2810351 RepID=A0ABS3AW97_9XANT|nr:hypothetical protein [Xanthomonas bonasiae]MBN6100632.1 hypothetical protein [Xanthomonas bonasiae]
MDAAAQLALMAKAEHVFGSDDTELSFPVTPLAFAPAALDLLGDGTMEHLIEFSLLANRIPDGPAWSGDGQTLLWEVYAQVLREAQFAQSTRTAQEEADYQAASAVLYRQDEEGRRLPTDAALAYRSYRDRYLLLQQDYLAQQATASAGSAEQVQAWHDLQQPALQRGLDDALADWAALGYRDAVEQAQAQVSGLGAKSPWQTLSEWKGRCNPDMDTLTRASDQLQVYPTSYAPSNALDEGSWRRFELSGAEIDAALAEAPAELRERLGTGGDAGIASLSFEFSSAALIRPWFSADAFAARFWRFADASLQLSDGQSPAHGPCTAYPVAVVFARDIQVQRKPTAALPSVVGPALGFDPGLLRQLRLTPRLIARRELRPPPPVPAGPIGMRRRPVLAVPDRSSTAVATAPIANAALRMPVRNIAAPTSTPMLRPRIVIGRPAAPSSPAANAPVAAQAILRRLRLDAYARDLSVAEVVPAPEPAAATVRDAATHDDSVYILAFICRPLPRCPDPDPTLAW